MPEMMFSEIAAFNIHELLRPPRKLTYSLTKSYLQRFQQGNATTRPRLPGSLPAFADGFNKDIVLHYLDWLLRLLDNVHAHLVAALSISTGSIGSRAHTK